MIFFTLHYQIPTHTVKKLIPWEYRLNGKNNSVCKELVLIKSVRIQNLDPYRENKASASRWKKTRENKRCANAVKLFKRERVARARALSSGINTCNAVCPRASCTREFSTRPRRVSEKEKEGEDRAQSPRGPSNSPTGLRTSRARTTATGTPRDSPKGFSFGIAFRRAVLFRPLVSSPPVREVFRLRTATHGPIWTSRSTVFSITKSFIYH